MPNKTYTTRWLEEDGYRSNWLVRNEKLLELFDLKERKPNQSYHFIEYGCGPNSPFSQVSRKNTNDIVHQYDLKSWNNETRIIDLNNVEAFPTANVSVFSGVLEYLNDVESILFRAMLASDYLLLSYHFVPQLTLNDDSLYLKQVHSRVSDGARNHYCPKEIISITSKIGVISAIDIWVLGKTNHLLLLLRNLKLDK